MIDWSVIDQWVQKVSDLAFVEMSTRYSLLIVDYWNSLISLNFLRVLLPLLLIIDSLIVFLMITGGYLIKLNWLMSDWSADKHQNPYQSCVLIQMLLKVLSEMWSSWRIKNDYFSSGTSVKSIRTCRSAHTDVLTLNNEIGNTINHFFSLLNWFHWD